MNQHCCKLYFGGDDASCLGDVYAVLKYVKDFGGSFRIVGGGIVIILLPMKQFLGSCLASSDLCLPGTTTDWFTRQMEIIASQNAQ
jgi:hypothetical protein